MNTFMHLVCDLLTIGALYDLQVGWSNDSLSDAMFDCSTYVCVSPQAYICIKDSHVNVHLCQSMTVEEC